MKLSSIFKISSARDKAGDPEGQPATYQPAWRSAYLKFMNVFKALLGFQF